MSCMFNEVMSSKIAKSTRMGKRNTIDICSSFGRSQNVTKRRQRIFITLESFYYQFEVAFQDEFLEAKFLSKGYCPYRCQGFNQIRRERQLNLFRKESNRLSMIIADYNTQTSLVNIYECCPIKVNLKRAFRWRDP